MKRTQCSHTHTPLCRFALFLTSDVSVRYLSPMMMNEPMTTIIVAWTAVRTLLLSSYPVSSSGLRPHPGSHITLTCHLSLGSSGQWQFLRISLFSLISWFGREPVGYFVEVPLVGTCLMFSSRLDWGDVFWSKDRRGEGVLLSYRVQGTAIDLTHHWDVDLAQVCLPGVLAVSLSHFFLSTLSSLEVVSAHSSHLRSRSYVPRALGQNIYMNWNSSAREICLFSSIYIFIE